MNFKQYLAEMNYGSLIDTEKYRDMDSANKALYKYTADGFTHISSDDFKKLVKDYPYGGGTIYRGLYFKEDKKLDEFLELVKTGKLDLGSQSSWTPSKSTAEEFARTEKSYFPTLDMMQSAQAVSKAGDFMGGAGGVIIKTTIGPNIGIDVNKTNYAKESEVLLPSGEYTVEIVKELKPFVKTHNTVEKAKEMVDFIEQAITSEDEAVIKQANRYTEYLTKSFKGKLPPEWNDIIFQFDHRKLFGNTPQEFADQTVNVEVDTSLFNRGSRELRFDVYIPFSEEMMDEASPRMQKKMKAYINAALKKIQNAADEAAKAIDADHDKPVKKFHFNGLEDLAAHDPVLFSKSTKNLKMAIAKEYARLNTREYNRTLKTRQDISKHGEHMAELLTAMAKLR